MLLHHLPPPCSAPEPTPRHAALSPASHRHARALSLCWAAGAPDLFQCLLLLPQHGGREDDRQVVGGHAVPVAPRADLVQQPEQAADGGDLREGRGVSD